ncbi:hypothetical protein [Vineibacter terrae]|uniref:hypothetical protein n=1 Tax=Vineibacter terrae TaxID=2586908 RepID=UPI002E2F1E4B|nr:hypothetical protein [Vineibacter terrae]HEX2887887.1 hypothetical protein [Vineibacter terrae]
MTGSSDRSVLLGWRVITSIDPRAPHMPSHGPSHATAEEALREACRRLEWQEHDGVRVIRIDGPDGEVVELAEIIRFALARRDEKRPPHQVSDTAAQKRSDQASPARLARIFPIRVMQRPRT